MIHQHAGIALDHQLMHLQAVVGALAEAIVGPGTSIEVDPWSGTVRLHRTITAPSISTDGRPMVTTTSALGVGPDLQMARESLETSERVVRLQIEDQVRSLRHARWANTVMRDGGA